MEEYIKDIIFIVYGLVLGTLGNLLYRANNHLDISPFILRILYGAMALALYVLTYLGVYKKIPSLHLVVMILIIFAGYFVELLIEILEDKLPKAIDRFIDKLVGGEKNNDSRKKND